MKLRQFLVMALCALPLMGAQISSSHEIAGILQDQTGAVIVDAKVVLLGPDGSTLGTTATNAAGEFTFRVQKTGSYLLRTQQEGFRGATLTVVVGQAAHVNARIVLTVSMVNEKLSVGADDSSRQVTTEAAQNKDVNELDRDALDRLPIFDQNYIATLSRFLDSDQTGENGASLIVNGVEANGPGVSASAIKSIKINQNPYSALYARPGRARIEIETAEGTPQFHGTINFLFRDAIFDARNAFAVTKPAERRSYIEGSVTGPLGHSKKNSFLLSAQDDHDDREDIVAASDANGGAVNLTVPNPDHHSFLSGRVFHQRREGEQVNVSYSYQHESVRNQGVGGTVLPEAGTNFTSFEHEINVGYNRVLTPRLLNQLHFLVGYNEEPVSGISNAPGIDVSGEFRGGGAQANLRRTEGHFDGTDLATYSRGKHELKFGIDVPDISRRGFSDYRDEQGVYSFASLAEYQAGHPYSYLVQRGNGHVTFLEKVVSGFFEDNYRFRPNLAVVAGVRYYWQNYFHDIAHDVAPRFSFAYAPGEKRKTVIRGGAGLFYDHTGPRAISDLLHFDGNHLVRLIADYKQPYSYPITTAELSTLPPGFERLNSRLKIPSTVQYSFGIERQVTDKSTLAATYIGSRAMNLFRSIDANAPLYPYTSRPDPNFGQIREVQSEGYQKGNSFELAFRGKPAKFFTGQARYALSKTYNNSSGIGYFPADSHAPQDDWGRSDNDRRHKFDFLGIFEAENRFTFGVALAAYSGKPVNETTGNDDNGDGYALDRPAGTPRNSLPGPAYLQLDLNLGHEFKLGHGAKERPRLAVTLDSFNVLNRRNDMTYIGVRSSSYYGRARVANAPRQMQLNLAFKF